jgi:hypothetical protein
MGKVAVEGEVGVEMRLKNRANGYVQLFGLGIGLS